MRDRTLITVPRYSVLKKIHALRVATLHRGDFAAEMPPNHYRPILATTGPGSKYLVLRLFQRWARSTMYCPHYSGFFSVLRSPLLDRSDRSQVEQQLICR